MEGRRRIKLSREEAKSMLDPIPGYAGSRRRHLMNFMGSEKVLPGSTPSIKYLCEKDLKGFSGKEVPLNIGHVHRDELNVGRATLYENGWGDVQFNNTRIGVLNDLAAHLGRVPISLGNHVDYKKGCPNVRKTPDHISIVSVAGRKGACIYPPHEYRGDLLAIPRVERQPLPARRGGTPRNKHPGRSGTMSSDQVCAGAGDPNEPQDCEEEVFTLEMDSDVFAERLLENIPENFREAIKRRVAVGAPEAATVVASGTPAPEPQVLFPSNFPQEIAQVIASNPEYSKEWARYSQGRARVGDCAHAVLEEHVSDVIGAIVSDPVFKAQIERKFADQTPFTDGLRKAMLEDTTGTVYQLAVTASRYAYESKRLSQQEEAFQESLRAPEPQKQSTPLLTMRRASRPSPDAVGEIAKKRAIPGSNIAKEQTSSPMVVASATPKKQAASAPDLGLDAFDPKVLDFLNSMGNRTV